MPTRGTRGRIINHANIGHRLNHSGKGTTESHTINNRDMETGHTPMTNAIPPSMR
ncbi:hypothetical protein A2U01_0108313, partial [Trifolium medium]|nr:hypothetical protein [Trifolium medium]